MGQTTATVLLLIMLLAAWLLYSFDPVLGIALGVAVTVIAIIVLLVARTQKESETPHFSSSVGWNEEEPAEPIKRNDGEPTKR